MFAIVRLFPDANAPLVSAESIIITFAFAESRQPNERREYSREIKSDVILSLICI